MSLYLTYRPQDFSSLVGQDFIKNTLQAAISQEKTVGAYLFTGPRGTGKTSTARIFAKALNCLDLREGNPCLKCEICQNFADNKLIDIIEIDAASYTGVDNIREIIEKAQFQATKCKYKVYIIDEVHMLSKGAFNALLKILEEPPKHVKFILATTEIHKVPETILSRCQRYDFKSITNDDMRKRLQFVLTSEKVTAEPEALEYIISSAQGGLRNALTLMEQLIVGDNISYSYIENTLWVGKREEVESMLEKLLTKDVSVLADFETLRNSGKNLKLFFRDVLFYTKDQAKKELLEWKDISSLLYILETLQDWLLKAKNSYDESTTFLIVLLRLLSGRQTWKLPVTKTPVQENSATKMSAPKEQHAPQTSEPELPVEEVADIFSISDSWFENEPSSLSDTKPVSEKGKIDITEFTKHIKTHWGKAALTMSLRGAQISLSENVCTITSQNKISKSTFLLSENQNIIIAALEQMGNRDIVLKIL